MFMNPLHRQRGVTLVELMVGLTVGLIVIGVVGSLFLTTMGGSNDSLRSMKLNQELRTALDYMAADIRRAGYWSAAAAANNPAANPYMVRTGTATDVFVGNGCIRYSYDRDDDGTIPRFGFRLQGGALQVPQSTALGAANGTNDNCNEGAWEALTDPNTVVIDELTFSTEGSQCRNLNQTTGTPPHPSHGRPRTAAPPPPAQTPRPPAMPRRPRATSWSRPARSRSGWWATTPGTPTPHSPLRRASGSRTTGC
ncbi:MAG: PilW family protein [Halothiobacillaceae bacterium]